MSLWRPYSLVSSGSGAGQGIAGCVSAFSCSVCVLIEHYTCDSFAHRAQLAALLLRLLNNSDRFHELSLSELHEELRQVDSDGSLSDHLNDALSSIENPDALYDLFSSFMKLVYPEESGEMGHLNRNSVFGLYVRETVIAFKNLSFSGLSHLFERVLQYRDNPELPNKSIVRSVAQQKYLVKRVTSIESTIGKISFEATESSIRQIEEKVNTAPQVHYLRYLNCLHHKEFEGSLSSLHRYFDASGSLGDPSPSQCRSQYAALSLAILHHRFGNPAEAEQALQEAVRIAQQNNDQTCLLRALGLLCHIQQHSSHLSAAFRLIMHSVAGSLSRSDIGAAVADLDAQGWMVSAKCLLQGADMNAAPSEVFRRLYFSRRCSQRCTDAAQWASISASASLMRASAWHLYGNATLSRCHIEGAARLYSDTRETALALANLAEAHEPHDSDLIVQFSNNLFPIHAHSGTPEVTAAVAFRRSLDSNNFLEAETFCEQLMSLSPNPDLAVSYQHYQAAQCARVELDIQQGRYTDAYQRALGLQQECERRGLMAESIHARLALAKVHQEAGNSASALPHVLSCLWLCSSLHLDSLAAETTLRLARIHLQMGAPEHALATVRRVLPCILENGKNPLKAEAHILMAECLLVLANGNPESSHAVQQALELLSEAQTFSAGVSKLLIEVAYFSAMAYHNLGKFHLRDRAALAFTELRAS